MEIQKIIFRGKRIDNGEWVYGFFHMVTKGQNGKLGNDYIITTFKKLDNEEVILTGTYSVIAETIGQYTGLTDKNEKKIFEGNIVKFIAGKENGIFEIKYGNSEFYADWIVRNNFMDITTSMKYLQCSSELEVIGNIFDNPELMRE